MNRLVIIVRLLVEEFMAHCWLKWLKQAHRPGALFITGCCIALAGLVSGPVEAVGERFDVSQIDDSPRIRDVQYPDWFKNSFLDLNEDLDEAFADGKRGLVVYFGQKDCAYCEALMQVNFGRETDIVEYTQRHFDIVPIDIWGSREVTDFAGNVLTEKDFAIANQANFTPSLIFFGADGQKLLQLRGYYTPYKLRAALEYVVDGHYRNQTLRQYMALADPPDLDPQNAMNAQAFFRKPPYVLDRSSFAGQKPLAVFFEQRSCHACDVLHTEPLQDPATRRLLDGFEVVQVDMWSETPLINPAGERLTARQWARQLGLFYAPSILFFDERGQEIIRVSSVVRVFRLRGVLEYVLNRGYLEAPTFQRWREQQSLLPATGNAKQQVP